MNFSGVIDSIIGHRRVHWRLNRALRQVGMPQGLWYRNRSGGDPGRAFIFCTSYINDKPRYTRWIDIIQPRREAFGASAAFLINDGPEGIDFDGRLGLMRADALPPSLDHDLNLIYFDERLGRTSMFCYPGWWRSFSFSVRIARHFGYRKIIHIESDAYVLSRSLADYIRQVDRGWTALWSPTYCMPETAIQIICEDSFGALEAIADKGPGEFIHMNRAAEYLLPFTKVEGRFLGDRSGVVKEEDVVERFDYLAQVPVKRWLDFEY